MNRKLNALYGLKWNPFLPGVPSNALYRDARSQSFMQRLELLTETGGFGLVTGPVGSGKSCVLRMLEESLSRVPDLSAVVLTRPQGSVNDFYRELGDLFGLKLNPCNRWGGAKLLRSRWQEHVDQSGKHAVILLDEAQEMQTQVLQELRLLSSYLLDSCSFLTVVLCGDQRLPDRLRSPDLLPVQSRIRVRLQLEPRSPEELRDVLKHALHEAGGSSVIAAEVLDALAGHAAGNLRVLMNLSAELLEAAVTAQVDHIDEKLFLETFDAVARSKPARRRSRARSRAS